MITRRVPKRLYLVLSRFFSYLGPLHTLFILMNNRGRFWRLCATLLRQINILRINLDACFAGFFYFFLYIAYFLLSFRLLSILLGLLFYLPYFTIKKLLSTWTRYYIVSSCKASTFASFNNITALWLVAV